MKHILLILISVIISINTAGCNSKVIDEQARQINDLTRELDQTKIYLDMTQSELKKAEKELDGAHSKLEEAENRYSQRVEDELNKAQAETDKLIDEFASPDIIENYITPQTPRQLPGNNTTPVPDTSRANAPQNQGGGTVSNHNNPASR